MILAGKFEKVVGPVGVGIGLIEGPRYARHRSCGQKRSHTESTKEGYLWTTEIVCFRHVVTASLLPGLVFGEFVMLVYNVEAN